MTWLLGATMWPIQRGGSSAGEARGGTERGKRRGKKGGEQKGKHAGDRKEEGKRTEVKRALLSPRRE